MSGRLFTLKSKASRTFLCTKIVRGLFVILSKHSTAAERVEDVDLLQTTNLLLVKTRTLNHYLHVNERIYLGAVAVGIDPEVSSSRTFHLIMAHLAGLTSK